MEVNIQREKTRMVPGRFGTGGNDATVAALQARIFLRRQQHSAFATFRLGVPGLCHGGPGKDERS
jgi:hypothetical protein